MGTVQCSVASPNHRSPELRNIWVVRAGGGGVYADRFEEAAIAAIGFSIRKDLSQLKSRDAFLSELAREHPNMKKGRLINGASQLYRFVHEIREGDLILTPVTDTREILFGTCAGPYRYDPRRDGDLPHTRPINWTKRISRDELTGPAKNSAGSTLTLFSMNDHRDEIEAVASGRERPVSLGAEADEGSGFQFYEDVQSKAEEQISDRIAHMDPFDFEELVAALLRSMGYFARRTEKGPDRGVDVVATSDALGLDSPRIKVQVKHRSQRASVGDMRNFIATLRSPDRGLFVSTGGFTREALYEADRTPQGTSVTTLKGDEFIELLMEHYERMEPEARAMIPLKRVFIPID